jgi:CheY-like chemotaxis protein
VHGVAKSLGGKVTVYSEEGRGTTFNVYLPSSSESETMDESKEVLRGTERILFVDDEVPLAKLGKHILEDLGYRVQSLSSSIAALSLFQSEPDEFDLLITDETMPQLKGTELAQFIAEVRPDLPVILCTGYGQEIFGIPPSIKVVLHKPVSRGELSRAIREALSIGS